MLFSKLRNNYLTINLTIIWTSVSYRSSFTQTIAGRMLLKRFGYASTIHFGVDRVGEDSLEGHAWLTCGKTVVTGGTDLNRYTEVHSIPL
jgi:hypothetical protein